MNVVFSVHNLRRNTLGREKGFLRKKVLVLDFKTGNAIRKKYCDNLLLLYGNMFNYGNIFYTIV